jgi:hypothetical protein
MPRPIKAVRIVTREPLRAPQPPLKRAPLTANGLSRTNDVRYLFFMADLPSAYPLRDLFDAAVRGRTIRLTCRRCRHAAVLDSHAMWWLFHRKGWPDSFADVRRRCLCLMCLHRRGEKVRDPELELVADAPTDRSLEMPSEFDWKRELRRRR